MRAFASESLAAALVRDLAGQPVGTPAPAADVPRRKEAEAPLRLMEAFVRHSSDAILMIEVQAGALGPRTSFVNEAFTRMTGYSAEEAVGQPPPFLCESQTAPATLARLRQAWESRQPVQVEMLNRRKDGSQFWVDLELMPVGTDGGSEKDGCSQWVAVQRDITERKNAEMALRDSEERFRLVAETVKEFIFDWDLRTGRVYRSPGLYELLGFRPEEVDESVNWWLARIHPDDRSRSWQMLLAQDVVDTEYRVQHRDGYYVHVWERATVCRDRQGNVVRVLGSDLDITHRHQVEEERLLLERRLQETHHLESLGVLAGGIAHDFNNLLTVILGNAELTRVYLPPDPSVLYHLDEIQRASQRAADLCRQMLAYAGKGRLVVQRLDLNALVRDTLTLLEPSLGPKVRVHQEVAPGVLAVAADGAQMSQVVANLVTNAVEALPDTGGQVTVRTLPVQADRAVLAEMHGGAELPEGEYIALEVRDTGRGMDEHTQARIFEPFFTTNFTGRGLGLPAVLGIVRSHQGALSVTSAVGRGSTFRVLVPRLTRKPATMPATAECQAGEWQGTGTVLVIDDDGGVRELASQLLQGLGFEVLRAGSSTEGLETYARNADRIRLVLLDLIMPGLGGDHTLSKLHQVCPDLPVVLMSGYSEPEALSQFAGRNLAGFLQKPFTRAALTARIRKALNE